MKIPIHPAPAEMPSLTVPPPPPRLSVLVHSGGFFCLACERFSEPTEETAGEVFARCARCGAAATLKFIPPALPPVH
jgi:hypothetical protein